MNWTGGFILRDQCGRSVLCQSEVLHQPDVELFWVQEFVFVIVNILLLDGAIKAFGMGIHLWCFRIGMPVGQVTCTELFVEVLHKLRAIVGQDVLEREGEEEGGKVEEVLGRLARMAPCGPSQGEAGGQIGERNDVSPVPLDEALDGIQGDAMARVSSYELLGFSALFGLFSCNGLSVAVQPNRT